MTTLVLVGSGSLGRMALEVAERMAEAGRGGRVAGFLDDDEARHGAEVDGCPVLGGLAWLIDHPAVAAVVCLGAPAVRRRAVLRLTEAGHTTFGTLVHPHASVARRVSLGAGTVVCSGAVIDTGATIGGHVLVNRTASVGHDVTVGDFVNVSPGAVLTGHDVLGDGVDLGAGVTVVPNVEVGAWSIIGAGAVVARSVAANVTAVGVPARPIATRPDGWHLGVAAPADSAVVGGR